jgi:hypothetical protein
MMPLPANALQSANLRRALASSGAAAQSAKDVIGTWTLVSADAFGPNPKGYVMFDANGHVSAVLMRSDLLSTRRTTGARGLQRKTRRRSRE